MNNNFDQDWMSAYLDNELSPEQLEEAKKAISVDAGVRHQLEVLLDLGNQLRSIPQKELPESFADRVMAEIGEQKVGDAEVFDSAPSHQHDQIAASAQTVEPKRGSKVAGKNASQEAARKSSWQIYASSIGLVAAALLIGFFVIPGLMKPTGTTGPIAKGDGDNGSLVDGTSTDKSTSVKSTSVNDTPIQNDGLHYFVIESEDGSNIEVTQEQLALALKENGIDLQPTGDGQDSEIFVVDTTVLKARNIVSDLEKQATISTFESLDSLKQGDILSNDSGSSELVSIERNSATQVNLNDVETMVKVAAINSFFELDPVIEIPNDQFAKSGNGPGSGVVFSTPNSTKKQTTIDQQSELTKFFKGESSQKRVRFLLIVKPAKN